MAQQSGNGKIKKIKHFSKSEIKSLINIWKDKNILNMFAKMTKHCAIYEKIAKELNRFGFDRNWMEIKNKINGLKAEYNRRKLKLVDSKSDWEFYNDIDWIIEGQDEHNSLSFDESWNSLNSESSNSQSSIKLEANDDTDPMDVQQNEVNLNGKRNLNEFDFPAQKKLAVINVNNLQQPSVTKFDMIEQLTEISKKNLEILEKLLLLEKEYQDERKLEDEKKSKMEAEVAAAMIRVMNAQAKIMEDSIQSS